MKLSIWLEKEISSMRLPLISFNIRNEEIKEIYPGRNKWKNLLVSLYCLK
jgi:hypothetical protein